MMPEKVFSFPGKRGLLSLSSYPLLPPPPPMGRRERGGASQLPKGGGGGGGGGGRRISESRQERETVWLCILYLGFPPAYPYFHIPKKIWAKLNSIKPRAFSSIDLFFSIEGDWGQEKELASSSSVSNFSSSSIE